LWVFRQHRMPLVPHDFVLFLTVAGVAPLSNHMRPEMFSLLLFSVLAVLLSAVTPGHNARLAIVPALMIVWINLHGGWLVGMGVLGVWVAVSCLDPRTQWMERIWFGSVLLAATLCTVANPYGYRLWTFL